MNQKYSHTLIAFSAIFIIVVSFSAGVFAGKTSVATKTSENSVELGIFDLFVNDPPPQIPEDVDLDTFWHVWNLINEKYVTSEMPTDEEKIWGAIDGLVSSLDDPYSTFLVPVEAKQFEEDVSGSFGGVGMEVGIQDNILSVISPLKNTPADKAGILSGDKIIQVDETPTYDLSLNEAVGMIRGIKGTEVLLTIVREGEEDVLEIPVIRDTISIPVLEYRLREDGIFVIELYSFYETAPSMFARAINEFKHSGSKKLILDLRNNPGGFLEASVDIAGTFLPKGKLVARESFGESRSELEHRTRGNFLLKDYNFDMVILINRGSASASEILAGALSEYDIAPLLGEQSFGKGSVQELIDLSDGTSLKITIARWLTPEGVSISDQGLAPDIEIERTLEDFKENRDPQIDKAIEILHSKSSN